MPTAVKLPGGGIEMIPTDQEMDKEFVLDQILPVLNSILEQLEILQDEVEELAAATKKGKNPARIKKQKIAECREKISNHGERKKILREQIAKINKRV